jgi:diacylglycerol kinase (ATP)
MNYFVLHINSKLLSRSNILFIINPISGGRDKLKIPELIDSRIDRSKFTPTFSFTEYVGHASEITGEASGKNFDVIVAVGGDGTINEIAGKVMHDNKVLGIIPFGSGNGLARFLKIPMDTLKAIDVINKGKAQLIDTGTFNDRHFFNMAGLGFDAHISSVFAGNKSRGFSGYIKLGLKEGLNYKARTYQLDIDGVKYVRTGFLISIANSSQYGNNVHIAPEASLTDGLLDVCIVKEFPIYKLPVLGYEMVRGLTHRSDLVEIIKGRKIKISRDEEGPIHIDGEPFFMGKEIEISVQPLSLNIIIPLA